jgi:glycosyltransferase involved in cell wall biosynthesis
MTQVNNLRKKTLYGKPVVDFVQSYYHLDIKEVETKYQIDLSEHQVMNVKENNELISVIIPTYNRKDMLIRAIESVRKQNYKHVEIIIINDFSTDGTKEYLEEHYSNHEQIKIFHNEMNLNAGTSRNIGYQASQGDYVIFLDDDDYYIDENFFSKAVDIHQNLKNCSFVSANALIEDVETRELNIRNVNVSGYIERKIYLEEFQLKYNKPLSTFTTLFKKRDLDSVAFETMKMMNDSSIYLRALCTNDVFILNDIVGVYVKHHSNISQSLNVNFILLNLEEKLWVFNKVFKHTDISKHWMSKQVILTMNYFIKGSKPDLKSISLVIQWIIKHLNNYRFITSFKVIILYLKRMV